MQVLRNRRCDLPYYHLLVSEQRHQTKKKRQTRKLAEDSDIIPVGDQMEIDVKPVVPRVRDLDVNFVDDDELQAALASSRRAKVKAKKISPEEIARRSQFYPRQYVPLLILKVISCRGTCALRGTLRR
jgi:SART-1 family